MAARSRTHFFIMAWATGWILATAVQLGLGFGVDGTLVAPHLIFWIVVVGAGGCAVVSMLVVARAFRENTAETALLGAFLVSASVLPFAHGLLVPGVLYGDNDAVVLSVQLALPVGALALVPLLFPGGTLRDWRRFVVGHLGVTAGVATMLLLQPNALPAPQTGTTGALAFAAVGIGVCLAVSVRQLRLAIIAQRWASLSLAAGIALMGTAPLIFVAGSVFGAAFWSAHIFDIAGVFLAGTTALFAHRRGATLQALLAPIEASTPLRSFAIGLEPLVHELVAQLDRKDPITRDHVVRTAHLAVHVAEELGLTPIQMRDVGLGAILHDVGKVEIPDEILMKPGRLSEAEFEIMKAHTTAGCAMVRAAPGLRGAASFVRGHHERVDGRGYPDQLAGDAIPLGARIVAACDAWDAMSQTRHYRSGMTGDRVAAIIREHRGSQWDARVVDALLRVIERGLADTGAGPLDSVGRQDSSNALACCRDALPV